MPDVNVAVGNTKSTGMFFHASLPLSGNMPTTLSALTGQGSGFSIAGLISEDGPSWTPYGSSEVIRLWDMTAARVVETEKGSMTVPVISTDVESMKTVFGEDAVTATTGGFTVDASAGIKNKEEAFALVGIDGDDTLLWTCEAGLVTEISDVSMTPTGALIWTITITGGWKFIKSTT